MEQIKSQTNVRKIVISAMLLALAIVINTFRITIPIGGAPVVRIGLGGPFLQFAAVMFGPLYGGAIYVLNDIIGFLINPQGGYIFPLTLTELAKGVAIGFLWQKLKAVKFKTFYIVYFVFFISLGVLGLVNFITTIYFENSAYSQFLLSIGKKSSYASIGLIIASGAGLLTSSLGFFSHYMMHKNSDNKTDNWFFVDSFFEKFLKLTVVVGIPNIIVTVINTIILQIFLLLTSNAFIFLLIPRVIETLISTIVSIYMVIILTKIYDKTLARRLGLEKT